jgi:hypothetical protein
MSFNATVGLFKPFEDLFILSNVVIALSLWVLKGKALRPIHSSIDILLNTDKEIKA